MYRVMLVFYLLSIFIAPAFAYTAQQYQACYSDAERLCGAPPDWRKITVAKKTAIIACMVGHSFRLSKKCLDSFR